MGSRPDSDRTERNLVSGQMDPDIFITIAFASFVFVAGMVGLILMTVMLVRSHRRAEGSYEQEEPPAATAQAPRRSPQRTPGRSHARRVHDRSRRSRVRT
jgi:flagellar biosynthesis/type III secretory pathway M-ring protein FliF/YscJ